jgi:hypothetical protein
MTTGRGVRPFAPEPEHYCGDTRDTDQLSFHLPGCSDDRAGAQSTAAAFRGRVSKIAWSGSISNGSQTSLNLNIASKSASSVLHLGQRRTHLRVKRVAGLTGYGPAVELQQASLGVARGFRAVFD